MMKNPFRYGEPVSNEFYVERQTLKNATLNFLKGDINTVLVGPRRFGKTSFLLNLLDSAPKGVTTLYVDLLNITSHRDFLNSLLHSMSRKQTYFRRFKEWVSSVSKSVSPGLSVDFDEASNLPTPKLSLFTSQFPDDVVKNLIGEALEELENLGQTVWVAWDEVQSITELKDDFWLEKTLRTKMQHGKNLTFIFSGSRRALIHPMFNDNSRAFYMSSQLIDFPHLGDEFTDWIISRFAKTNIKATGEVVQYLRKRAGDSPNYTQMICFGLVALGAPVVTTAMVDTVVRDLTRQNSYGYQSILSGFSPVQQRVLRMVAIEEKRIFSRELLKQYDIKAPSHVTQAINAGIARHLIDDSSARGRVQFDDPFFSAWLKELFADGVVY
jgi:hypothetical protein